MRATPNRPLSGEALGADQGQLRRILRFHDGAVLLHDLVEPATKIFVGQARQSFVGSILKGVTTGLSANLVNRSRTKLEWLKSTAFSIIRPATDHVFDFLFGRRTRQSPGEGIGNFRRPQRFGSSCPVFRFGLVRVRA
jgi:hypothetical protein